MFIEVQDNIFFLIFSILTIISVFLIIYCEKVVYSVIFLIFFFINISALLLLLKVEFLSIIIVLVYISAITIFFLFIVMTTNIKTKGPNIKINIKKTIIGFISGFLWFYYYFITNFFNIISVDSTSNLLKNYFIESNDLMMPRFYEISSGLEFHAIFYNCFILELLVVGFILLITLIGVVILTTTNRYKIFNNNVKTNNYYDQYNRKNIFKIM